MGLFNRKKKKAPEAEEQDALEELFLLLSMLEKENEANGHEVDPTDVLKADYGYTADNPVYMRSIPNSYSYLNSLQTESGAQVTYERLFSTHGRDETIIDVYRLYVNGEFFNTLYLCPYGKADAANAPAGLKLKK